MRIPVALLACLLTSAGALPGCTSSDHASAPLPAGPRVVAADLDQLVGAPWTGTLTYLDYTSKQPTTIRSTLTVVRLPPGQDGWDVRIGYSDEPHADSGEAVVLGDGGRTIRNETVTERTPLADGSVRIVTEEEGEDDRSPATIRHVYLLAPGQCSIQKLVRPAGRPEFFERNVYRWSR